MKDLEIIIDRHRYEFILDTERLTKKVRKKGFGTATSNRHINMLCALGFLKKVYQSKEKNILLKANENFLQQNPSMRPINVFSFHAYTEENLQEIEERAKRLRAAGITSGNISQNQLVLNGLRDIAEEVYFANNRYAPNVKAREAAELFSVMEWLCDDNGYASRAQIKENLTFSDTEIDKLLRIYRLQIQDRFSFSPPTREEMEKWKLKDRKYIYKRKENNHDGK